MKKISLRRVGCIFGVLLLVVTLFSISAFALEGKETLAQDSNEDVDIRIEKDLDDYVASVNSENEAMLDEKLDDVITTITFSEYLSFEELNQYLESYGLQAERLFLRGVEDDGTRVTVFTKTYLGMDKTEEMAKEDAESLGYELVGVTAVYVFADSEQLSNICQDSRTYLADTSGDLYSPQNQLLSGYERNGESVEDNYDMFPQPLTWDLENAGILK
jgi:hypothetical protein